MPGSGLLIQHSLIIPAYNEAALLPRLLDTVDEARARYMPGADRIEVIVADNASTDTTAKIAADRDCRVVEVEKRVIAAARNGGAHVARGAVFSFIDADSRIHPDTFNAIDRALADGRVIAGATGVRLERWSIGILATYLAIVPLVVVTGMDTGVVFCPRGAFEEVGGYNERRLFAEDVAFLWNLKRRGRQRGQHLTRLGSVKALASMRKFDQFGDWHYFTLFARLGLLLLRRPFDGHALAQRYWYERKP